MVHGFVNLSFSDFFRFANSKITRGHCLKLQKVQSRINIRSNFFSQRVVNEWNGLPEDVVIVGSVNAFKNALDKYFKLCNGLRFVFSVFFFHPTGSLMGT